jgi:hypothetical protein
MFECICHSEYRSRSVHVIIPDTLDHQADFPGHPPAVHVSRWQLEQRGKRTRLAMETMDLSLLAAAAAARVFFALAASFLRPGVLRRSAKLLG